MLNNNDIKDLRRIVDKLDEKQQNTGISIEDTINFFKSPIEVNLGRKHKLSFMLVSIPLRLIANFFLGLLLSILLIIGEVIVLTIISAIMGWKFREYNWIIEYLVHITLIVTFLYYFIKIFKEELALFKALYGPKKTQTRVR